MSTKNVEFSTNLKHSFRVLRYGIKRDFTNIRRYKVALLGWLMSMLLGIGSAFLFGVLFYFNPTTQQEAGISSDSVFVFFASGIAMSTFVDTALWAPMGRINKDIHYGTLESVFVSPANRLAYLVSPAIADSILNLIFFIPAYLIIMAVNGTIGDLYVIGMTLLIVLITMLCMIAFGVFFAMIAILIRKVQPLANFLGMLFQFFCGAYVPVQAFVGVNPVFGSILKYFAMLFPYTYCYDLFRFFTFGSEYKLLLPLWLEILFLGITSVAFYIIAALLLKRVERKAKNVGLSIL